MTLEKLQRGFFSSTDDISSLKEVSNPVARSWSRLRNNGFKPVSIFSYPSKNNAPSTPDGLTKSLRQIGPKLRSIIGNPDESACALVDADGILSAFDGGEIIMRDLARNGWRNGLSFKENFAGTNAIDLCLRDREPMITKGFEHTVKALHDIIIIAYPLLDQSGNLLGSLSLFTKANEEISNSQAVTALSAMLLEAILQIDASKIELLRRVAEQKAIADAMKDCTMVVSREGIIEYMNRPAGLVFKVDPEKAVGQELSKTIGFEPVMNPVFETGIGYTDEEVRIKSENINLHLIDTAVPIKDGSGKVLSVVNTFREFEQVAKVAQKFGGNQAHFSFDDVIGQSPSMMLTLEKARRAATGISNILISGESGTGKELFAQGIHLASQRANRPFVAVNCAALPRDLIEAELFGYVAGSFTGAHKSGRPGKFEIASGGTIFLDEISEMPLDVQAKLLRVLQEREITRIGGAEPISVDVRIIAAMNKEARKLVMEGRFREDLYYRINVIEIAIPALREREGDIRLLAQHYIKRYASLLNKPTKRIAETVLKKLEAYGWPGNVRELQNIIERMVNFSDDEIINEGPELPVPPILNSDPSKGKAEQSINICTFAEMEKNLISKALQATNHNVTKTADLLQLTKPRLYRLIKKHKIKLERALNIS